MEKTLKQQQKQQQFRRFVIILTFNFLNFSFCLFRFRKYVCACNLIDFIVFVEHTGQKALFHHEMIVYLQPKIRMHQTKENARETCETESI